MKIVKVRGVCALRKEAGVRSLRAIQENEIAAAKMRVA